MAITVSPIQDLTLARLRALGLLIRQEVYTAKSDWVCQAAQKPGWYSDTRLRAIRDGIGSGAISIWVGLIDNVPKGICWINNGDPDRLIFMFLVDSTLSPADALELADQIAIRVLTDVLADPYPGKRNLVSHFPNGTPAAAYATLCGFRRRTIVTTPTLSVDQWEIGIQELLDNIQARRAG